VLDQACVEGLRWHCRGAEAEDEIGHIAPVSTFLGCRRRDGRTVEGVEVRLFGQLEVTEGGAAVAVRGTKQRALLALLALQRGEPVSADRLIDVLWGDGQATNPSNALQAQIGQLRRALGATAVVTSEAGYALDVRPDDVDVVCFEQLVAEGRRLVADGKAAQGSAVLGEALRLRRGEPLAEFAFVSFADAERTHLDELTLEALESRAEADLVLGRHGELVGELEGLCRDNPLRERLWELLMLALYRSGRQAEALRAYGEARDGLVGELGISPGPALRGLEGRILAQDPTLSVPDPQSPPGATVSASDGNLRAQLNSFFGRDPELEQLAAAVRASRLVTLIGPGGAGKTRLAVEAAAGLREEHRDGVWLVELAGVANPVGVAPAAAGALGAGASSLGARQPAGTVERIVRHLAGRSLVIVLDNCEHVIGAAAALVDTLLGELPGLALIATSREALGVPGEVLVAVRGLSLSAAVELFTDRARAVRPGFAADGDTGPVIEDICRRLDGLPLAVELAAARLRALTLRTVAERLDDRFRLLTGGARTALPRQQTLRAVVDWSYDLLFDDERRVLVRLAVFVGGCRLDAAEAVCADEQVPAGEVLDVLCRLVDKSLVTAADAGGGEARFSQLQTLWQYGRQRLADSGEADATRAEHAAYHRQMAGDAHDGLRGTSGPVWRDRLTSEMGNLRAALDWFIAVGDADAALSLTSGMAWLWFINTDFTQGARWLGDALDTTGPRRAELEATARAWHGYCVGMSTSPAVAVIECEEAVAALRVGDDPVRLAEALVLSATVLVRAHEFGRSLEALGEAHDLLEAAGQGWLLAAHDLIVAWDMASLGHLDEAEASARSSVERFDAEGEVLLVVSPLNALAGVAEARGDLDAASVAYEALLQRCRATGQRFYVPFGLVALAALRARQGDDDAADGLYQEAIGCCANPWLLADAMVGQAAVARRLGDLARGRALLDAARDRYRDADLPSGHAGVLAGLAWWALATDRPGDATVFAADAVQIAIASGDPATQLLADTAMAAAKAITDPTSHSIEAFLAFARQRAHQVTNPRTPTGGLAYRSLIDEPDVAALAASLVLPTR